MSRSHIMIGDESTGAVIRCDVAKCKEKFVTYSCVSVARDQAKAVKWLRVPAWQITDSDSPDILKDVCPEHAELVEQRKASRQDDIAARAKERSDKFAEVRAAKKEAHALEVAANKQRREAERAQKKADKVAQRGIDKAKRKAERLEAKLKGHKSVDMSDVHGSSRDQHQEEMEAGGIRPYPEGGA